MGANLLTSSFPWGSLETIAGADVRMLRAVRRWAADHVRLNALEEAITVLLGAPVRVRLRRLKLLRAAPVFGEGYGVRLEGDGTGSAAPAVLLQVDGALATAAVARAIRQSPARIYQATTPSPAIAGAVAAVVVAATRRAAASTPPRVTATGSAMDLQTNLERTSHDLVAADLTVVVGDDAYRARVVLPALADVPFSAGSWTKTALQRLGLTPLSLPIVAAVCRGTATDVASLRAGDVLVVPQWPLRRAAHADPWLGQVFLAAPTGTTGIAAQLGADWRVMLGGDPQPLCVSEAEMTESDESSALVNAVGDIPLVIRVEIGEARMAARDWAILERGDVVALGRRIGEPVILRVGGVPIATGELVQVDGDVGVRIIERLNDAARANP